MVERNNRVLGDSLRDELLRRGKDEWDLLLPQLMKAYRVAKGLAAEKRSSRVGPVASSVDEGI